METPAVARRRASWATAPALDARPAMLVALDQDTARPPSRARLGDAGLDLFVSQAVTVPPGEFVDVDCGLRIQLPDGYWGRITGRSSTLRKRRLLVNEAVIDNGYVGPLYAGVWNLGPQPVDVAVGDRLAQLILHPIVHVRTEPATLLVSSDGRGEAGFGSSGR